MMNTPKHRKDFVNPGSHSFRPVFFVLIIGFFLIIGCQPVAAVDAAQGPADAPVHFPANPLALLPGIVSFECLVIVMTVIFSLLIGCIKERKNQFIVLGILLVLIVLKDMFPLLLTGTGFEGLAGVVAGLLTIIGICRFPLVVVLAGMLWFWPENKIIWKDAAVCSALVFIAGMSALGLLAVSGILTGFFVVINGMAHSGSGNPAAATLVFFFCSLVALALTLLLSWLGFHVIAEYRNWRTGSETP
jgi:hypothetical protein